MKNNKMVKLAGGGQTDIKRFLTGLYNCNITVSSSFLNEFSMGENEFSHEMSLLFLILMHMSP